MLKKIHLLTVLLLISLSFPALYGKVIDVTEPPYNAQGDGIADDTVAIQGAINDANYGDLVRLPPGTYKITDTIKLKSGINLWGYGYNNSIIKSFSSKSSILMIGSGVNDVSIKYLRIDGSGFSTTQSIGIRAEHSENLTISKCRITNIATNYPDGWGPQGIGLFEVNNVQISDNVIDNIAPSNIWGTGIRVTRSTNIRVNNNEVRQCGRAGISFDSPSEYIEISNNVIVEINSFNMSIETESSKYVIIEDNICDSWISVPRSSYLACRRNYIGNSAGRKGYSGIEAGVWYGVFTDNILDGPFSDYGIALALISTGNDDMYNYWGHNKVKNADKFGVHFYAGMTDSYYFYDCEFTDNAIYGINFSQGKDIVFENCKINYNKVGIRVNVPTDRLSFVNCEFRYNNNESINILPLNYCEWVNNTVTDNGNNLTLTSSGQWGQNRPVANFNAPATAQIGTPVTFQNSSTDDGFIKMSLWDFGEGYPSNTTNPTYTYQKEGTYTVTLIVWDNDGKASRIAKPITVGPIFNLPLNEGIGVPQDVSGNSNTVSIIGNPQWIASGYSGSAMVFNGIKDALFVNGDIVGKLSDNGHWRLETQIKITDKPVWRNMIIVQEDYLTNGFRFGIDSSQRLVFWTTQSGGSIDINSGSNTIGFNVWTQIAVEYNNGTTTLYINNNQVAQSNNGLYINSNMKFRIGSYGGGGEGVIGMLDDIKILTY